MPTNLTLPEIESRICDIVAQQQRLPREKLNPDLRLMQDLNIDSLEVVELLMAIEDAFEVSLPDQVSGNPAYKAVFTRREFRLRDLAELVYLQKDTLKPEKRFGWDRPKVAMPPPSVAPFTQLGGVLHPDDLKGRFPFEVLEKNAEGYPQFRRLTDGMVCVEIPDGREVTIGSDADSPFPDEQPMHQVMIKSFLMDIEPVSTTAYCRFLNSVGPLDESTLQKWFLLPASDRRRVHQLISLTDHVWTPVPGTERFPMVLVSWFAAQAYSIWVNRCEWPMKGWPNHLTGSYLPSEAEWEYAARGADARAYPWGNAEPNESLARFGRYERRKAYSPVQLPLADVNLRLGMSPFGLRHMAGNVWQWCRDFYAPEFYRLAESVGMDSWNRHDTGIRAERGGSWIGPGFLCRSSYRRGRIPSAKGRCLGFRCVSKLPL